MRVIKTIMPALIMIIMISLCWWGIVLLSDAPVNDTILRTDPIFGVTLNGDAPQRVRIYEIGDDFRPDLYEVYYFPELVTNGEQGHYEVFRTLGKDR